MYLTASISEHLKQRLSLKNYALICTIWVLASWLTGTSIAQILETPSEPSSLPSQYGFINFPENQLFLPEPTALAGFFTKLKQLEDHRDERVRILHIGDSHIQADIFSGKVRTLLQNDTRFIVSARGLVFPYSAAKTNNPTNYSTRYTGLWEDKRSVKTKHFSRWGLPGISLETHDPNATITINPNLNGSEYATQKVSIFHAGDPDALPVVALPSGTSLIGKFTKPGITEYVFSKSLSTITVGWQRGKQSNGQPFILQGIVLENMLPGISYSAVGINSADAASYTRCQDLAQQLAWLRPDLVIVSLGTNDAYMYTFDAAAFKRNLRNMVLTIKKAYPQTNILFTTPADNYRRRRTPNRNNAIAAQAIRELASETGAGVWDLFNVMGGNNSIAQWQSSGLAQRDFLHFTKTGYELQGSLLFYALDDAYRLHRQVTENGQ